MATREHDSSIGRAQSLVPASRTAAGNGTGVDLRGFESASVVVLGGAISGTTPSFTFVVQESDDNATFTDVAAGDLLGSLTAITTADQVRHVGYRGSKCYIRARLDAVGGTSTPTLLCSAHVERGTPDFLPVS